MSRDTGGAEFAAAYRQQIDCLRQAWHPVTGFPWRSLENLTYHEARGLAPLVCGLQLSVPADVPADPATLAERVAQMVGVALVSCDPAPNWQEFARQIDTHARAGASTGILAVAVLVARCACVRRSRWKSYPQEEHRLDYDERMVSQRVSEFVDIVEWLAAMPGNQTSAYMAQCDETRQLLEENGEELSALARDLFECHERDRQAIGSASNLRSGLKQWRSIVVPGGGDKEGHHSENVYMAFDAALPEIAQTGQQEAVGNTRRLFETVGVALRDEAIRSRRSRRSSRGRGPKRQ